MKQDPKPYLSRAALEASKTYWEAEWDKANEARRIASNMFKNLQKALTNENQAII